MRTLVSTILLREFTMLVLLVCALAPLRALATTTAEGVVIKASAVVQESPPKITLTWPAGASTGSIFVYRKADDGTAWGSPIAGPLANTTTGYEDASIAEGAPYEYWVHQGAPATEGYVDAGIKVPLVEDRGKIVLIVDSTYAVSLASELTRLQEDLVGDGWRVLRHDLDGTETVADIKALIKADYDADPANVSAVFLFGHVPVPYSGDINPDLHSEHLGAWPADVFYGEMNGTWTDATVNDAAASRPENRNVPGDGKYDQSSIPTTVELMVGRVDLADMPAFALSELELLRQYLNKDHAFRHKTAMVPARALVADDFSGLSYAQSGWRFSPLVGAGNVTAGAWSSLMTDDYLLAYGCGPGTYTSVGGIVSTSDYAANTYRAMFQMLFGSYFGDWDNTNNVLRAPLCNPTYGLTSCWAARPNWYIHHMGLGKPIGYSARLATTTSLYNMSTGGGEVHIALMGDPTLRLQYVAPPSAPTATAAGGNVDLAWTASPDAGILGYHVYRSADPGGPFTRLSTALVSGVSYSDTAPLSGDSTYMVRAVRLETSASGTYYNASQGIFVPYSATSDIVAPTVSTVAVQTSLTIDVTFSEAMGAGVTTAANYVVSGTGQGTLAANPTSVALVSGNKYRLTWA
ncbi:MAG: fibronectin type III domain-containing protein, partial [Candidatus Hydrogenedentes bacterium]|nr:fibronectin type III domain-containing protein [Candidatus Hydrogenedentota bacterium]